MCHRLGARLKPKTVVPPEEVEVEQPIIVNLPPVKLREYKAKKVKRGDEEIAVFHAGDGHAGKITKSFDEDVYKQRMDTTFDSIMTVVTLHRNMYPVNTLHIVNTGDNSQGENPFQGSKVGTIKLGARDQTTKVAYPAWVRLISSLKQEFAEVVSVFCCIFPIFLFYTHFQSSFHWLESLPEPAHSTQMKSCPA